MFAICSIPQNDEKRHRDPPFLIKNKEGQPVLQEIGPNTPKQKLLKQALHMLETKHKNRKFEL